MAFVAATKWVFYTTGSNSLGYVVAIEKWISFFKTLRKYKAEK